MTVYIPTETLGWAVTAVTAPQIGVGGMDG